MWPSRQGCVVRLGSVSNHRVGPLRPPCARRNADGKRSSPRTRFRKDFTLSERVAILESIERKGEGRPSRNSQYFASSDEAARRAGFGNRDAIRRTIEKELRKIERRGRPRKGAQMSGFSVENKRRIGKASRLWQRHAGLRLMPQRDTVSGVWDESTGKSQGKGASLKPGRLIVLAASTLLAFQPAQAQDRPDNIRPWVPPADTRSRVLQGLQPTEAPRAYEDRSAGRQLPVIEHRNTRHGRRSTAPLVGRGYQFRSAQSARALQRDHAAFQYRSDLAGMRQRLEREYRSDRRSFDRLQRLRREESRMRR